MTNTIKPITQPEMTQTKIEYSIKIGRQVLKEKLKVEIAKIRKSIATNTELLEVDSITYKAIYAEMKQRIMLYIDNDETFHSIKLLYNIINVDEPITDVITLINTDLNSLTTLSSSIQPQTLTDLIAYRRRIKNQFITLNVDFFIGLYDKDYNEYNDTSFYFQVDLTSSLLALMTKQEKILSMHVQYSKELNALEDKLHNLDETMEAMEAKLLVQELDKTVEGKEVLAVTETIINDTLNSQLSLT